MERRNNIMSNKSNKIKTASDTSNTKLTITDKECKRCKKTKTVDNFYFRKNRGYYESNCRQCEAEKAKERRENKEVVEKMKASQKKYYEKNKAKLNAVSRKYHHANKERMNEMSRQYYRKNAEVQKQKAKIHRDNLREQALAGELEKPQIKKRKCTGCNKTKKISHFTFRKTRNVYDSKCKRCNRKRERRRRELYNDEINARRKELEKTPEQILTKSLRSRLNGYIKYRNGKNMYLKLLGCDKKFLVAWFEYNFDLDEHLNMKWSNHGYHWHIDHVTPCASYNLLDKNERNVCFHWTNLSPVLKPYNLSKGAQIRPKDERRQRRRVKKFIKFVEEQQLDLEYSAKAQTTKS